MRAIFSLFTLSVLLFLIGCTKETEDYQTDPLSSYLPLETGKYISYRLDSTVFTQSGRKEEVHVYQEKLEVAAQLTDNLGRPSYRIDRYIRDSAGQNPWSHAGTSYITPSENSLEVINDNLRILKLTLPVKEGVSWKGNRYLPSEPYAPVYNFSNDNDMSDWEFTYGTTNESINLNGKNIDSVATVTGPDEAANAPVTDPKSFGARTYAVNKYAKNIGLVYEELIMWEYQPNPNGTPFKVGFGVKRSIIDHN